MDPSMVERAVDKGPLLCSYLQLTAIGKQNKLNTSTSSLLEKSFLKNPPITKTRQEHVQVYLHISVSVSRKMFNLREVIRNYYETDTTL